MDINVKVKEKVSIVIPCYNQAQFLSDAIMSALNQTYQTIQVIVVNDGSTDETTKVIQYFQQRKSSSPAELIVVNQENKGLSAARNAGIKASNGKFIVCLDADDKLSSNYVELTSKWLEIYDIVCTGTNEFGSRIRRWKTPLIEVRYRDLLIKNRLNYAAIYKKEIWEKIGGYDENMKKGFEDWNFWLNAAKQGYKIRVLTDFLFYYRKHNKSMFSEALKNKEEILTYMKLIHPIEKT